MRQNRGTVNCQNTFEIAQALKNSARSEQQELFDCLKSDVISDIIINRSNKEFSVTFSSAKNFVLSSEDFFGESTFNRENIDIKHFEPNNDEDMPSGVVEDLVYDSLIDELEIEFNDEELIVDDTNENDYGDYYKDEERILKCISNGLDIFEREVSEDEKLIFKDFIGNDYLPKNYRMLL